MKGPIFDYIYDEINKLDSNFNIITRRLSSFNKDENTNYRKMNVNQAFYLDSHIKLFECMIYTDNFFDIKKIMFSLFEIFEFKTNIIFLFSKFTNGFSKLYIYEKGEENLIYYHCNNDLTYHITTDTRKKNNFSEYLSFNKEFEYQKNMAIKRDNLEKLKKNQEFKYTLFEKEKDLILKEQQLKELELKQKESLFQEQQFLELKKLELEKLEFYHKKSVFEKEQELVLFQQNSIVVKTSTTRFGKYSNLRRSPRLKNI